MGQLVDQQGAEEEQPGEDRQRPNDTAAPRLIGDREVPAEREYDQQGDEKPTVVQPDLHPEDAT
jgi:hypothetical protein